jgi:tRNA threonylcarbamoyladenosine biosynthesis protein TsaE
LGERWGREAADGWLIGLTGDLGAGKTQLVKGIARGLGIRARVLSPTFALVHEYKDGRLPLTHLDLYRLDSKEAIARAGLQEYFTRPRGVVVVEWIERWLGLEEHPVATGVRFRRATLHETGEHERRIDYEDTGA